MQCNIIPISLTVIHQPKTFNIRIGTSSGFLIVGTGIKKFSGVIAAIVIVIAAIAVLDAGKMNSCVLSCVLTSPTTSTTGASALAGIVGVH